MINSGVGYFAADLSLAVLLLVAAVASWWNIAYRGHSYGGWLLAIGFTTFFIRVFALLIMGGDPLIPPISLMSLSLIAAGWSVVALRKRSRLFYK